MELSQEELGRLVHLKAGAFKAADCGSGGICFAFVLEESRQAISIWLSSDGWKAKLICSSPLP